MRENFFHIITNMGKYYSNLRASIGLSWAAFFAGVIPKPTQTIVVRLKARISVLIETVTRKPAKAPS